MTQSESSQRLPYVSVVIPMRNEESFIARCLDSILANDYAKDRFEIIVVDGMSTDRSPEIVKEYAEKHDNIRILENPKKIRVTANNIGIRHAKGEIIISMDAHVLYAQDYVRNCVELLQTTGAATVGAIQNAVGTDFLTRAIAIATTTPFGIGNAEFRYTRKEKWVDAFFLGAWYKETLDKVGLFNEEWVRNGDYELNYRIRKAGGKVLVSPKLKCQYFVRSSLPKLARQYLLYGKWRVKTIVTHPESVRWRHLLPPALILWLLLSPIMLALSVKIWWIPVTLYLVTSALAAVATSIKRGVKYLPLLLPIFWTLHLSWGIGFYTGIFSFGFPRIKFSAIWQDVSGKKKFG